LRVGLFERAYPNKDWGANKIKTSVLKPVNSMSFIWNDNMREKREANANAT
jgi:hypothetical protein